MFRLGPMRWRRHRTERRAPAPRGSSRGGADANLDAHDDALVATARLTPEGRCSSTSAEPPNLARWREDATRRACMRTRLPIVNAPIPWTGPPRELLPERLLEQLSVSSVRRSKAVVK